METIKIGNKIAEARKRMHVSQAQLAQQLFISPQAVGKWERGESLPDIITLNRLAQILGTDLNYFSDTFQSVTNITDPKDTFAIRPDEPQPAKQRNRLNRNMSNGNWADADFSGLKNLHDKFSASNMKGCLFVGSELAGLLLKGNNVEGCDFSGSDFSKSHIQRSNLSKNAFKECSLQDAEFSESYVSGCDFTGADFTGTVVKSGGLEKCTLADAAWNRTSFRNSYLADLVFNGTLEDCSFENCAFTRVKFQNARLINTFFKNNKNLKRIQFIDCEADRLTYAFLKNGNANLEGIRIGNRE
jgi:uncharacterized protein YjbI with pentapeptide repeats